MNNDDPLFNRLPEEWIVTKVGAFCQKPEYGFTESAVADEIGPKFLRITDITENGVNWDTVPYCRCPQDMFPKYELKKNDILFARIGATTGKSFIVKNPPRAIFASYLIRLRPLNDIVPDYLYYFFKSDLYWDQVNANKKNNLKGGVNSSILADIRFPLPSNKKEQQQIAAVLFKIQQTIEIQESIIEKTRELKKSTMHHVFTHGLRGEKLKETEIGIVPESWRVRDLDSVLKLAQYGLSVRGLSNGQYPILRMNCQFDGQVHLNDLQYVNLDNDVFKKFKMENGDILFNRTNSWELVGRTAIYRSKEAAVFASYLIRLRLDENEINPDFLNHFFNMDATQNRLKSLASRGVSQSNISASKLKTFQIPMPAMDEQLKIINILHAIDQKIETQTAKKSVLQDLFKTMLNKLMTGEIRVKDLDIDVSEVTA